MEIKIQAKNIALNQNAESYIYKKFDRIQRHLNNIGDATIEVSRTKSRSASDRVKAQMTLSVGKYTLRGQDSGVNLFAAVDGVADVVNRQIDRFKSRVYHTEQAKKRRLALREVQADIILDAPPETEQEDDSDMGEIVRTKRFTMTPMTIEDAILQMEMLGHSFFLFFNTDTDEYNVAYRRNDGDYGVIEPELV